MIIINVKTIATIVLMGLAVYITRIGGYWLAGRVRINNVIKAWLEYLPGCIIMSIVAPFVLKGDWLEMISAGVTILVMWLSESLLLSMVAGIAIVAVGRLFL